MSGEGSEGAADREVLFEHRRVGTVVRVCALDTETGTEVTVMGPLGASPSDLERLALAKLKARLAGRPGGGTPRR